MALLKHKDPYYHIDDLIKKYPHCQYYMVFGEKSNGKTYSILERILKNFCKTGKQGAVLRRWDTDFKGQTGRSMFNSFVKDGVVSKLTHGEYNDITYYANTWTLARRDEDNPDKIVRADKPLCYAFALNTVEHMNGSSYPDITTILFDEFMSRKGYLPDEFMLFQIALSNIIRRRTDVTIFMMGNTLNKSCPYFKEMGLGHVEKMEIGQSDIYSYGNSNLHVAVEHAGTALQKGAKPSDVYFAFDNPALDMITQGDWQIKVYPHKPVKFKPKDIQFTYFIIFEDYVLQCEIVMFDDYNFTFVHPKTSRWTDDPDVDQLHRIFRKPEDELIFTQEANPLFNITRKMSQNMGMPKLISRISEYYNNEKVFYSDNSTGEIMRNYMLWCNRETILS